MKKVFWSVFAFSCLFFGILWVTQAQKVEIISLKNYQADVDYVPDEVLVLLNPGPPNRAISLLNLSA
jgi:hypothetical protein